MTTAVMTEQEFEAVRLALRRKRAAAWEVYLAAARGGNVDHDELIGEMLTIGKSAADLDRDRKRIGDALAAKANKAAVTARAAENQARLDKALAKMRRLEEAKKKVVEEYRHCDGQCMIMGTAIADNNRAAAQANDLLNTSPEELAARMELEDARRARIAAEKR